MHLGTKAILIGVGVELVSLGFIAVGLFNGGFVPCGSPPSFAGLCMAIGYYLHFPLTLLLSPDLFLAIIPLQTILWCFAFYGFFALRSKKNVA